mgnify:CR=1 FL=1
MSISPAMFDVVKARLAVAPAATAPQLSATQAHLLAAPAPDAAHVLAVELRFARLDVSRLEAALHTMVERHDALRMDFCGGQLRIAPRANLRVERCASLAAREAFCFAPFDIASAPLMRAAVVVGDPLVVWLCWHHLIFDGWSYQVFVDELARLYRGALLPPAPRWTVASERAAALAATPSPVDFATRRRQVGLRPLRRLRDALGDAAQIEAAARKLGVSSFEWLLASLALLFSRLGDALCVRFHIADSNRSRAAPMVGPLSRRVGVELAIDDSASFADLVAATSARLAAALREHGDDASPASATIAFQNAPTAAPWPELIGAEALPAPTATVDHLLTLQVRGAALDVRWDTARDTISDATATSLLRAWQQLLTQLLAGREPRDIEWAGRALATPHPAPIPGLAERFEAIVAERGTESALVCGDRSLSYRDLDELSGALMRRLTEAGIRPGQAVLVDIEAPLAYLVAIVALARLGMIYVPCDAQHPRRLVESWGDVAAALTHASGDWVIESNHLQARCDLRGGYRMYTSGSTGAPKPARISERSIVQLALMAGVTAVRSNDRMAMIAPVGFDASTFEIWATLLNGATLIAPAQRLSAAALADWIEAQRISVAFLGSGWFELLVDFHLQALRGMRLVLSGGEVMSPAHAARFLAALPAVRLVNVYGPTENTTFTTAYPLSRIDGPIPLGAPLPGRSVLLLDRCGRLLPPGIVGEAWLGGDGVMLTDGDEPRVRQDAGHGALYRSGDRLWLENGELHFAGRIDRQVKWRGFRVHLDHVEAALRADPDVRAARVDLMRVPDVRLVAEVELHDGAELSAVRQRMAVRWPATMLPSDYRVRAKAMLPSGKRARREQVDTVAMAAPLSPMEAEVLAVLQQALAPVTMAADDDFYERGGHSLLALRVLSELMRRFERRIEIAEFNAAPNARALARCLAAAAPRGDELYVDLTGVTDGPAAYLIPGGHGGDAELALYRAAFGALPIRLIGVRIVSLDAATLGERARLLAQRLAQRSPSGPLRIVGECIGGVLAQEAARLLSPRRVDLLLLDTWPMTDAGVAHYTGRVRPRQLRREAWRLRRLAIQDLARVFIAHCNRSLLRSSYRNDVLGTLWRVAQAWKAQIADVGAPRSASDARGAEVAAQALAHRTAPGPALTLIAPRHSRRHQIAAAWQPLAEVRQWPVPGDHSNYLRRFAAQTRTAVMAWWEMRWQR